jgi:hypothetical protein
MMTVQEFFQLVLWVSLGCWLIMLVRQLWVCCRVGPEQLLILLIKDQEEIIEGLICYLRHRWHKIEGNRWEIIFVDLGSKDQTGEILRRQIGCPRTNLTLLTLAGGNEGRVAEEKFIQGLTKGQEANRIAVLTLTGKADGRKVCGQVGRVLAGDFESAQKDLTQRGRLYVLERK